MGSRLNRRSLLQHTTAAALLTGMPLPANATVKPETTKPRKFKLGMVTYNLAMTWDLKTLLANCKEIGASAVEFRAEKDHKHGVELTLNKQQRKDVVKACADAGIVIWAMGSQCEYHAADQAVVREHIEQTKRYIELAADLGAKGVKVRPNGFPKDVSKDKTLEQIGRSLRTVAEAGSDAGIEIWCEVHGRETCQPPHMHRMMTIADHPNVGVVWNSNMTDIKDGSVAEYFKLLRPKIYSVHINELINDYPYREFFSLLRETNYDRYTMIEGHPLMSANVADNVRFAKYYAALWNELSR